MTFEVRRALVDKIKSSKATIGVIGIGYVGLPLAVKFAEKGFSVKAIEKKPAVIRALTEGKSFVPDVTDDEIGNQLNKNLLLCKVEWEYQSTSDAMRKQVADCDVYIICVPTPLKDSSYCDPDIDFIKKATEIVEYSMSISTDKEKLIILESTTYPGCTEEVTLPRLKSILSTNINLVYSPERTNPGGDVSFTMIPKIVGGLDEKGFELAYELYLHLFGSKIERVSSIKVAETVKCAENAYRLLSISFANKLTQKLEYSLVSIWNIIDIINKNDVTLRNFFPREVLGGEWSNDAEFFEEVLRYNSLDSDILTNKQISINSLAEKVVEQINHKQKGTFCDELIAKIVTASFRELSILFFHQLSKLCNLDSMKISIREVITAILTKPFGLNLCNPGPGAGGHCIPIDPLYLYWRAKKEGICIPLIWEAYQIDEEMPDRVVQMIKQSLYARGKRLNGSNVLMLGVTYKQNVPDLRESKAVDILKSLLSKGANLFYCDPVFSRRQLELYPDSDQWMDREFYLQMRNRTMPRPEESSLRFYLEEIKMEECAEIVKKGLIDCVVIFANHDEFSENHLYKKIVANHMVDVIDTRNVVSKELGRKPENVHVLGQA